MAGTGLRSLAMACDRVELKSTLSLQSRCWYVKITLPVPRSATYGLVPRLLANITRFDSNLPVVDFCLPGRSSVVKPSGRPVANLFCLGGCILNYSVYRYAPWICYLVRVSLLPVFSHKKNSLVFDRKRPHFHETKRVRQSSLSKPSTPPLVRVGYYLHTATGNIGLP